MTEVLFARLDEVQAGDASLQSQINTITSNANTAGLAALPTATGLIVEIANGSPNTFVQRLIAGTTNEISITNAQGVSGNPTISLASTLTLTGKTVNVATQSLGNNTTLAASTAFVIANAIAPVASVTDKAIVTWNGTSGALVQNNSKVTISSLGAIQIAADGSPTNVLNIPSGFTNSSLMVGAGGTTLVHNAGTFQATITGTDMNVTSITTGTVPWERLANALLSGAGVTAGTQIRGQISGTPNGVGHYTVSPSQTVAVSTAMTATSLQGYYNTSVGLTSFINATTASYNSFFGFETGEFCTTCFANTGIGEASLIYNIDGVGNTGVGWKTLLSAVGVTIGDYNVGIGYFAASMGGGLATTATSQNTAVGSFALSGASFSGASNSVFGYGAGIALSTGGANLIGGLFSGITLTTGGNNTILSGGSSSGNGLITGSGNTLVGNFPLSAADTNRVILADGTGSTARFIASSSGTTFTVGGSGAVITLPIATDTLVGLATTDTLLNKTISAGTLAGNFLNKGDYILETSAVQVTHTGDTAETTMKTITVPANALGANGRLRITAHVGKTGTAATFEVKIKFGGTIYYDQVSSAANVIGGRIQTEIQNRNATNSQVGNSLGVVNWAIQSTTANVTSAIDTTSSQNIVITMQNGSAADTTILDSYLVEIIRG